MGTIVVADHSGFCFGVKRAISLAEELIKDNKNNKEARTLSLGPLIHNEMVTMDLEKKGLTIALSVDEIREGDKVVIRSHGETCDVFTELLRRGAKVVDATCPFVEKIQNLVREAHSDGKKILIVGDRDHPEVIGINGWCENSAFIVGNEEEAEAFAKEYKEKYMGYDLFVVCQTTMKKEILDSITTVIEERGIPFELKNTICNATTLRQEATEKLAKVSDVMLILGDKHSSNTKKLYSIAKKYCEKSYFIENIEELLLHETKKWVKIGIAAGASTPKSLIKEVIATMSEMKVMSMEELMAAENYDLDGAMRLPRLGEVVDGTVHQVTEKGIIVDMGCKKDGIIPKEEITLEGDQKLTDLFKAGDAIQAKVIKTDDGDGVITLSKKKLEVNANWTEIVDALESKEVLNVKVIRQVNGGVIAQYKEVSGFIPLSQLSDKFVDNAEEFIGQELDVRVTKVDQKKNRAVFSHKVILIEEKETRLSEIWSQLHVDDVVEGKVMRFTEYGAFVDLGGIDGLLHISEISWGKLKHPQEVLAIGDVVRVKVLSMNEEKRKISLGLKQCVPEPWSVIDQKYEVGQIVSGKVVQIKEYGAFIELEPGLDGLVHISEVAHKRVNDIAEEISVGQTVETKILEIDTEKKRISLSIKQTVEAPAEEVEEAPAEAPLEADAE